MSIFAYVGFPGSGKSYSVVAHQVLPALKAGRTVVTNLPMKADLVKAEIKTNEGGEVDLRGFDLARAMENPDTILADVPAGSVWVLDEVYKLFPAGVTVAKVPEAFKAILAEHRHRVNAAGDSMQVVFVCQDLAQIAAFARQLVETTFRTTKLTALGMHKRFRVDVFNGPVSGANPPMASRLREIPGKYDPKVFRYYISHTLSESGKEGANELAVDKRANIFLRPLMIAAPIFCCVALYWGLHHLQTQGEKLKEMHDQGAPKAPQILGTLNGGPRSIGGVVGFTGSSAGAPRSVRAWVVKGYILNLSHPENSLAGLVPLDGRGFAERPYQECHRERREPLRCELNGSWYSETGDIVAPPLASPIVPAP